MKKKMSLLLVLALITSLFLTACNTAQNVKGEAEVKDTLVIAYYGEATTLDPRDMTSDEVSAIQIYLDIYNPLIYISEEGEVLPGLAEKWEHSNDGLTYIFTIRKNVKFHNGDILTAEDVVFSLDRMRDSKFYSTTVEDIEKAEKLDDYSLKVTLKKSSAFFIKKLEHVFIVDKKLVEAEGNEYGSDNAIGTGPFKIAEVAKGQYIKVERFDDYFEGPAKLKAIIYKPGTDSSAVSSALETGELDMSFNFATTDADRLKANPNLKVDEKGSAYLGSYMFNYNKEPFNNKRVRQAIAYAIDKESALIASTNGFAKPVTNYLLSEDVLGYSTDESVMNYAYNIEHAKQLLTEAGYPDGFDMILTTTTWGAGAAETIQSDLAKIGIDVTEIETLQLAQYLDIVLSQNYDFAYFEGNNEILDGEFLYQVLYTTGTMNWSGYSNSEVDKILDNMKMELDDQKRAVLINEAVKLAKEDCPLVPYYFAMNAKAYNSKLMNIKTYSHAIATPNYDVYWAEQ